MKSLVTSVLLLWSVVSFGQTDISLDPSTHKINEKIVVHQHKTDGDFIILTYAIPDTVTYNFSDGGG